MELKLNSQKIAPWLTTLQWISLFLVVVQFPESITEGVFLASLTFITVLVIFVPFLAKRDWKLRKKQFLENVWKNHEPEFKNITAFISEEMNKPKSDIDFDKVYDKVTELEDIISIMDLHKKNKKIDIFFFQAFLAYLFSILFGIFLSPPNEWANFALYSSGITVFFFSHATVNLVKIIINWYELQKIGLKD